MVTSGGFFEVLLNEIFHYRQFLQHYALEKALFRLEPKFDTSL